MGDIEKLRVKEFYNKLQELKKEKQDKFTLKNNLQIKIKEIKNIKMLKEDIKLQVCDLLLENVGGKRNSKVLEKVDKLHADYKRLNEIEEEMVFYKECIELAIVKERI